MNRAGMTSFGTTVADKWGGFYSYAVFLFKARTDAVAFVTGAAFVITDDHFVAGIGLLASIPMDTEIIRVIETPSVPGVDPPMPKDLL